MKPFTPNNTKLIFKIKPKTRIKNTINHLFRLLLLMMNNIIRIKGTRMYRLTLYDSIINIPVAEEIVLKRTPKTIKNFIQKSTIKQPLISITTDQFSVEYKNIMDDIGVKQQIIASSILFKMIGNTVYKKLRSKRLTKHDKIRSCLYFHRLLKTLFRTKDQKTAIKRLET